MRVLDILAGRSSAMAQPELEEVLSEFDRVTLYRTLNSFEAKGIVHGVVNGSGVRNFAMCVDSCGPDQHHDHHIHLECDNCGKLYCLDEVDVPDIKIPVHYKAHGLKIITQGVCPDCQ